MDPEYLGDGVYASLNSFGQIVITTGHHNPDEADNVIYLEPEIAKAVTGFIERATNYPKAIL